MKPAIKKRVKAFKIEANDIRLLKAASNPFGGDPISPDYLEKRSSDLFKSIRDQLSDKDGVVQISTPYKSTVYTYKHRNMFRLSKDGKAVLVQHGSKWVDISWTNIRFGKFQRVKQ